MCCRYYMRSRQRNWKWGEFAEQKVDAMSSDASAVAGSGDAVDLGLPKWLDDMLKPGVGSGVFLTLKLSLIGLVLTLCLLLSFMQDPVCILFLFF